jgi:hypothetical protein
MTVERYLRLIAGTFVLASVILGYWQSPYWFFFTGFVALNLVQSAFPLFSGFRWRSDRESTTSGRFASPERRAGWFHLPK